MTESHAYAYGRVRALEVGLIDTAQLKRMVDARTADDMLKVLSETPYGSHLPEHSDISDIEKAIVRELKNTYEIIDRISPQRDITDLFQVKYDMHNLKVLLKSEIMGRPLPELISPLGREGPESIRAALEGDLKAVSEEFRGIIVEARSLYEEQEDFQAVQFFLDREHARILQKGFALNPFLQKFFAAKADLENIRNYMRASRARIDFEAVFVPGGGFDLPFFADAKDQPVEYFTDKTRNKDFAGVVSEGLTAYQNTGSLSPYEKLTEDFLIQYMKKAKFYSLSIEPVVGYIFAKEREAHLVRQIFISKMKGIDITNRVSEVYE